MKRGRRTAIGLIVGVSAGALAAGCGSSSKAVPAASTPAPSQATQTSAQPTTSTRSSTSASPAVGAPQGSANGGTSAPSGARAAPEPAFTQQAAGGEGASGAAAIVRAKGFTPNNSSDYHANQALRVLIATRTGSASGDAQQAFFFVNDRYIGTDSSQPSATLRVVAQGDTEVTLAYPLYRKGDPLCCPGGGQAQVRFQLNNGRLAALDPIPPASSQTGTGRR